MAFWPQTSSFSFERDFKILTKIFFIGEKLIASEREKAQAEQSRPNGPSSLVNLPGGNPIPVVGGIGSSLAASLNELQARATRAVSLLNEAPPPPPPQEPPAEVNQEHVSTLMDMGFPRERCIEALHAHSSLDQATDYLLNNPVPPQRSSSETATTATGAGSSRSAVQPTTNTGSGPSGPGITATGYFRIIARLG